MGDRAQLHPTIAPWKAAPSHTDRGPRASHPGVAGQRVDPCPGCSKVWGERRQCDNGTLRCRAFAFLEPVALNVRHDSAISNLGGLFA